MPIYKYTGYGPGGRQERGTLEAEGPKDAARLLKAQGIFAREIAEDVPVASAASRLLPFFKRKRTGASLPGFTRQLAVLLGSGSPLVEALSALSDEARTRGDSSASLRPVIVDIRERVMAGASLARAMEDHPEVFPEFYRNMVSAGQESGNLEAVLKRMADYLENQERIRGRVETATIYPVIMIFVSMIVLVIIFTFVVPKIVKVFETTKATLPLATVILIAITHVMVNYWWLLLAALGGAAYYAGKMKDKHREKYDKALMDFFKTLYLARFSRTLGFLLEGGLPMLRSLELAGKSTGNLYLERRAMHAAERVSEGSSLAAALEGMPPVFLQLVATGERSGKLSEVLGSAAAAYEGEFDRGVERALAMLQPIMILAMALVVGFIVFAVLLPLFEINQLIGK